LSVLKSIDAEKSAFAMFRKRDIKWVFGEYNTC
jgi:hypothetical protein